jgi:enamine deaminase RidA (YjgF/YER057c/UK114 family)
MSIEIFQPKNVHDATQYAYSQATRLGDLIFVAGQVPLDVNGVIVGEGDIQVQTEQVFRNLKHVLEEAGSGLDRVGKVTVFTTKLEYRPVIHQVRTRVFKEAGMLPASTLAIVTSLADPRWLVEIDAVAVAR